LIVFLFGLFHAKNYFISELIEDCWDPLSTTQTLKLVKLMNELSNDYPSLRVTSKNLHVMFTIITDKMKAALDNDVFIPIIFQKQLSLSIYFCFNIFIFVNFNAFRCADAKSSFFQRQFYSGVKLFRNFISFQGIIADKMLKSYAIFSLLNRYLLSGMRVSVPADGVAKAHTIVLTLPYRWLISADKDFIESFTMFCTYVSSLSDALDCKNPCYM
jgi:GC-rich sequence DNA-binding factor